MKSLMLYDELIKQDESITIEELIECLNRTFYKTELGFSLFREFYITDFHLLVRYIWHIAYSVGLNEDRKHTK